jgi:hypothetical protein
MKKDSSLITELLSIAAIAGNVVFVLWILFNGINEGFKGTRVEKVSFITLMGLLACLFATENCRTKNDRNNNNRAATQCQDGGAVKTL